MFDAKFQPLFSASAVIVACLPTSVHVALQGLWVYRSHSYDNSTPLAVFLAQCGLAVLGFGRVRELRGRSPDRLMGVSELMMVDMDYGGAFNVPHGVERLGSAIIMRFGFLVSWEKRWRG